MALGGVVLVLAAVILFLLVFHSDVGRADAPTPAVLTPTQPLPSPNVFPSPAVYGLPGGRVVYEYCDNGGNRIVLAVDGDHIALNTVRDDKSCPAPKSHR